MKNNSEPHLQNNASMTKIALLSDIHANLPAFEAVLQEVQDSAAESIVFLGDIVGYGASPVECVDLVCKLGGKCVMGNHDVEIGNVRRRGCSFHNHDWRNSGYQAGLAHAAKCLDADQAAWLAGLPYSMKIPGAVVAHASLEEPEAFSHIHDAKSARPTLAILRKEKIKVGFFGHTHVSGIFADDAASLEWLDEARVKIPIGLACAVTVGAVGQPRQDPDHCASWVLWDPAENVVEFRKSNYDRLQAAQEILRAGLPLESAMMLLPKKEETMLDLSNGG